MIYSIQNIYTPGQQSATSHWDVINDFGRLNRKVNLDYWPVYDKLKNLKHLRQQADYHVPFKVWSNGTQVIIRNWPQTTNDAIINARFVVNTLASLTNKYP